MIGSRSALCELVHRNLSSPSPGNQGVKMTDIDAPSVIEDLKKKILNAVYHAALFGWGRIAAGSKFLLTTSSCWQVAFRTGWACKLSCGSYLFECLLLLFTQVTADWVLCKILRLEKFQREYRSFVWTRLYVPSSACTSPEVVVNEWNQASCRSQLTPGCAFVDTVLSGVQCRGVDALALSNTGCVHLSAPFRQVPAPTHALGLKGISSSALASWVLVKNCIWQK